MAYNRNLDLVEISPNVRPPVCKLMDYSKFKYEQKLKEKENKRKNKKNEAKEIVFSPSIADNDIETKIKSLKGFLEQGRTVQLTLRFKRREVAHKQLGYDVLNKVIEAVVDIGVLENKLNFTGNRLIAKLLPKPKTDV